MDISGLAAGFRRADLEFSGVDHSGASYQAWVFLNHPEAEADTPHDDAHGYAGSFSVFGHGGCYGDDHGHCTVVARRPHDPRPGHPLTPATKTVIATAALRGVLGGITLDVTIVPIVRSLNPKCTAEDVLQVIYLRIITYGN